MKHKSIFHVTRGGKEYKADKVPQSVKEMFGQSIENIELSNIKIGDSVGVFVVDDIVDNVIIFVYKDYEAFVHI